MPIDRDELPSTIKRSPDKAQRTFMETLESAEETYGPGERARRTAYASLKHSFEKVGDHWEEKDEKGPSDERAARGGAPADRGGKTHGGVDVKGNSKAELMERAKKLGIGGRSQMTKDELGEAINKANQRETARAGRDG